MRVLITGNMGYVGPVLVRHLRQALPGACLIGYDAGFFAHCLTGARSLPEAMLDAQHYGDARELPAALLAGVDAVVHLAAVSNDPIGARFEEATAEINQQATLRLAALARDAGVASFVYASSCSIYGAAEDGAPRKETDATHPLTAYARSKIGSEVGFGEMPIGDLAVTCLRFATACGMSDRLRLDLVLNDFVACAITSGNITVLSDGTPWRPLIDVADMARAIEWAVGRKRDNGGALLTVNVGTDAWNYRVSDLAEAVARAIPGTSVSINAAAPPDRRSYRVDFGLFRTLAPNHQPRMRLEETIAGLRDGLLGMGFDISDFRNSPYMRLKMLERHIEDGTLMPGLRWAHWRSQGRT